MNKLEVGMYVRTKTFTTSKICKLKEIDNICLTDNGAVDINQIAKSSFNIIDLIEVGDYVNGIRVDNFILKNDNEICFKYIYSMEDEDVYTLNRKDIKSIVTKEQFESMKYEVE